MKVLHRCLLAIFFALPTTILGQSAGPVLWTNEVGIQGIHGWNLSSFRDQEVIIKTKWAEIGNSLASSASPFAGTYEHAGNTGYFLRWSPEKGFVYAYYHEDWIVAASYGDVTISPSGIVHFIVTHENPHEWRDVKIRTPTDWVPVLEGTYFVQTEDIRNFADFYGGFGDFNGFPRKWNCECGPFALRLGKETRRQRGFIVPNTYLQILRQPISGHIIGIGKTHLGKNPVPFTFDERASLTSVTVDIGHRNGVKPGLLFLIAPDNDATDQFVRITRVRGTRSSGVVVRELDEKGNLARRDPESEDETYKSYPKLFVGQQIATSFVDKLQ